VAYFLLNTVFREKEHDLFHKKPYLFVFNIIAKIKQFLNTKKPLLSGILLLKRSA